MATHFSILAWKIPWMEEPGGLQSLVSQRVRHSLYFRTLKLAPSEVPISGLLRQAVCLVTSIL